MSAGVFLSLSVSLRLYLVFGESHKAQFKKDDCTSFSTMGGEMTTKEFVSLPLVANRMRVVLRDLGEVQK